MAILFLITGLPLSGKSSIARVLGSRLGADVIDLDGLNEVRGVQTPTGTPMQEWARTEEQAETYIRAGLAVGRHVVVDWVNYPRAQDRWRRVGTEAGAVVRVIHVTTAAGTVRRRYAASSSGAVDPEFLETVIGRWVAPEGEAIAMSGAEDANAYVTRLLRDGAA